MHYAFKSVLHWPVFENSLSKCTSSWRPWKKIVWTQEICREFDVLKIIESVCISIALKTENYRNPVNQKNSVRLLKKTTLTSILFISKNGPFVHWYSGKKKWPSRQTQILTSCPSENTSPYVVCICFHFCLEKKKDEHIANTCNSF